MLLPGQPTSTHPIRRASSAGSSSRSLSAQKSQLVCPGDPNLQPPALGLPLFSLRLPPLRVLLSCFWPRVPRADHGVKARRNPPPTGSSTWRAEHQPTAPHSCRSPTGSGSDWGFIYSLDSKRESKCGLQTFWFSAAAEPLISFPPLSCLCSGFSLAEQSRYSTHLGKGHYREGPQRGGPHGKGSREGPRHQGGTPGWQSPHGVKERTQIWVSAVSGTGEPKGFAHSQTSKAGIMA